MNNEEDMNNEPILDEECEFYFESDHLALKGDKDYSAFLKTIVTLEAQRAQAIRDLDELKTARSKAMEDPIAFVAQLQNGDYPELPCPQTVADIPHVDWSQYDIGSSDARLKPHTRHKHTLSQVQQKNEQESGKVRQYYMFDKIVACLCTEIRILVGRSLSEVVLSMRVSLKLSINCGQ